MNSTIMRTRVGLSTKLPLLALDDRLPERLGRIGNSLIDRHERAVQVLLRENMCMLASVCAYVACSCGCVRADCRV